MSGWSSDCCHAGGVRSPGRRCRRGRRSARPAATTYISATRPENTQVRMQATLHRHGHRDASRPGCWPGDRRRRPAAPTAGAAVGSPSWWRRVLAEAAASPAGAPRGAGGQVDGRRCDGGGGGAAAGTAGGRLGRARRRPGAAARPAAAPAGRRTSHAPGRSRASASPPRRARRGTRRPAARSGASRIGTATTLSATRAPRCRWSTKMPSTADARRTAPVTISADPHRGQGLGDADPEVLARGVESHVGDRVAGVDAS